MSTTLNPYLNWRSSAREAMEFYQSVFGGELTASTFKEFGMPVDAAEEHLIMHAQLVTPDLTLMGADTPSHTRVSIRYEAMPSVSAVGAAGAISVSARFGR